jgi:hypothetical protein
MGRRLAVLKLFFALAAQVLSWGSRGFGSLLGNLRTMEGRKIGMSGHEISKLGGYAPILLGGFMLYSACFRRSWGKGKRFPVTWYMRLFAGGMGFLLWFFGIRLVFSK